MTMFMFTRGDRYQPTKASYLNGMIKISISSVAVLALFLNPWPARSQGIINTFAGNGNPGFAGDGGLATAASLMHPRGIAFDSSGGVYIADMDNWRVRRVSAAGIISTIAGNGTFAESGDGGQA